MLDEIYHSLDPVAFQIGGLEVRWYGLGYMLGLIIGMLVIIRVIKRWKINITLDNVLTLIICAAVGIFIGGRLGYVLFYKLGDYIQNPISIFAVWEGGMSFHGGVIGMVVAIFAASRFTRVPYMTLADLIVIAAPLGIFMVRCANFINGELWGATTDLPWGVVFGGAAGDIPRHPTQLYEACLEGVLMFIILYVLSRKLPARPRGTFTGTFLVLYGVFRILVEFVRQPDVQLGYLFGGWLTMGMVLSLPMIVLGAIFLWYAHSKKQPQLGVPPKPDDAELADDAADTEDVQVAEDASTPTETTGTEATKNDVQ